MPPSACVDLFALEASRFPHTEGKKKEGGFDYRAPHDELPTFFSTPARVHFAAREREQFVKEQK